MLLRPNYRGFAANAALFPLRLAGAARELVGPSRRRLGRWTWLIGLSERAAERVLHGQRDRGLRRGGARRPRPHQRLPACSSASSTSPPPTSTPPSASCSARASGPTCRSRRRSPPRRALPMVYEPVEMQGPRVHRRRHPLDDERRHRGRARRQVHRRRQPDRALRQRLLQARSRPSSAPASGASPTWASPAIGNQVVPAALPRPPAPRGRGLGGGVPRRRHHPDRARARRRADVRHLDHGLLGAARRSPSTASSRSPCKLARDYDRYKAIAERHGIEISARRVHHVLEQVERERDEMSAWRRVLEQTTAALLRQQPAERDEASDAPPTPRPTTRRRASAVSR